MTKSYSPPQRSDLTHVIVRLMSVGNFKLQPIWSRFVLLEPPHKDRIELSVFLAEQMNDFSKSLQATSCTLPNYSVKRIDDVIEAWKLSKLENTPDTLLAKMTKIIRSCRK